MRKNLLGGLDSTQFMRRHWQKNMLLARHALPQVSQAITREDLFALAQREDVECRIVRKSRGRWRVDHGPFDVGDLRRLPKADWTLLVQAVDQHLDQAARLLREFAFIPYARFDDVMVSYAAPGGGVGPHFDSYDVFLVQGPGRRLWRVSSPCAGELVPDTPLRILRAFRAEHEWTLASGDLLYLPPQWPHEGVALEECITYSVGFRAPTQQELGTRFLEFLQDRLELDGRYMDPELGATSRPGVLPSTMIARFAAMLMDVRWSSDDVLEFTGRFLTEPKTNVVFARPERPLQRAHFIRAFSVRGIKLALPSRMLVHGGVIFINGEMHQSNAQGRRPFAKLADERALRVAAGLDAASSALLYDWYRAGYIEIGAFT